VRDVADRREEAATRYEKTTTSFLCILALAAAADWLGR
jgi:hypothetical protein